MLWSQIEHQRLSELSMMKDRLARYCQAAGYDMSLLSKDEIKQLCLIQGNQTLTPEARESKAEEGPLNFEVQRALARFYAFIAMRERDYASFVKSQDEPILSEEMFSTLCDEAGQLDIHGIAAVRASCFLVRSSRAQKLMENRRTWGEDPLPEDSEAFVTRMAQMARQTPSLFPLTSHLVPEVLLLLEKAFWPNLHFRHMLWMEGSVAMTRGLQSDAGVLDEMGYRVWKFRWIVNLAGFKSGPGARFYNADIASLVAGRFRDLDRLREAPEADWMEGRLEKLYLQMLSSVQDDSIKEAAGKLQFAEQYFLAFIALNLHVLAGFRGEYAEALIKGYLGARKETGYAAALAAREFRQNPDIITPTYVPAVLNSVLWLLITRKGFSADEALQKTAAFCCDFFNSFYRMRFDNPISCRELADVSHCDDLDEALSLWLKDRRQIGLICDLSGELTLWRLPRLNFALIPEDWKLHDAINIAAEKVSQGSDYRLGRHSLGHSTLAQIYLPVQVEVDQLWRDMVTTLGTGASNTMLRLDETAADQDGDSLWLRFQVNRKDGSIDSLHEQVLSVLDRYGIKPISLHGTDYDPHVTLSHTTDAGMFEVMKEQVKVPLQGRFRLVLGESSPTGELKSVLFDVRDTLAFQRQTSWAPSQLKR